MDIPIALVDTDDDNPPNNPDDPNILGGDAEDIPFNVVLVRAHFSKQGWGDSFRHLGCICGASEFPVGASHSIRAIPYRIRPRKCHQSGGKRA